MKVPFKMPVRAGVAKPAPMSIKPPTKPLAKVPLKYNVSKAVPVEEDDPDWQAVSPTASAHEAHKVKVDTILKVGRTMTRDEQDKVIEARYRYMAENVDMTLSPAVSQLGQAAYIEARRFTDNNQCDWHDAPAHIQVMWCAIALAVAGAHHAQPYKPLSTAPRDPKNIIFIWYDGDWRRATFSPGKKALWHMRDGYQINADDRECINMVYMQAHVPSFATGMEMVTEFAKNNKIETAKLPVERPSKITQEIRSPSPLTRPRAAVSRGSAARDGAPPRTADYYPPPKDIESLNWQKVPGPKTTKLRG